MTKPENPQNERLADEALEWVSRISLGDATKADIASLRQWRDTSPDHAATLARATQLWRQLEEPAMALSEEGRADVRPSRRAFLVGGAAAAAAASIGILAVHPPLDLWPSLAELSADHRTGTGEQQHLILADAVSVDLNTRTSITMRSADQSAGLELISGEVAVAMAHAVAKPFVVLAGGGRITANQATFNLRRDGSAVDLTCVDGMVSVDCGGPAVTLRATQRVSYYGERLGAIGEIDPSVVTAWLEGILVFHDTPLASVIEEVNRYRPGRIILMDRQLGQRMVTARFDIKKLDKVMREVANAFKVPVKSLPGGIVLIG
jgi:transmembrane sensor